MTTSWITQVSMEPVLVGVGVDNDSGHPPADRHRRVVHRQPVVGRRHQGLRQVLQAGGAGTDGERTTLNGRLVRPAPSGAPVFDDALAWFDCEVRQSIDFGTHTFFVGEITAAAVTDDDARVAAMSDTRMKYGGVKRH